MGKKPFRVEYHNTSHCDIIGYVAEGTGIIETASEKYTLMAGDSYLIRSGERYKFRTKSAQACTHMSIGFCGEIVTSVLDAYGFAKMTVFEDVNIYEHLKKIKGIVSHSSGSEDVAMDQCCTIFVEMCQYIRKQWRIQKQEIEEFKEIEFQDVEMLRNYMDTHLNESFTLKRCSEIVSLSVSQMSRRFRNIYGVPPCKYLNNQRIETAKKMLRDTTYSIQEIAELVGFRDTYYFSRFFKKECGKSPKEYRENINK